MRARVEMRLHKDRWHAYMYWPEVKRKKYVSLRTTDKQVAEKRYKEFVRTELPEIERQQVLNEVHDGVKTSLYSVFIWYVDSYINDYAKSTREKYCQILSQFMDHMDTKDIHSVEQINYAVVLDWYQEYVNRSPQVRDKASPITKYNLLMTVKGMFTAAYESGMIEENPARGWKIKRGQSKRVRWVLDNEQLTEVLGLLEGHWSYPPYAWMRFTGMRVSDTIGLRIGDIIGGKLHIKQEKTGEDLCLDMPGHLQEIIDLSLQRKNNQKLSDYVFLRENGQPFSEPSLYDALNKKLAKAKFNPRPLGPHTFRHSLATNMARAGCNPKVLQRILGHKNVSQTLEYYRVGESEVFDALSQYGIDRPILPRQDISTEVLPNLEAITIISNSD